MEDRKSKFMEQVGMLLDSENFEKISKISLENEGVEKLEENVEKFSEGLKVYGDWLGKTYGTKR